VFYPRNPYPKPVTVDPRKPYQLLRASASPIDVCSPINFNNSLFGEVVLCRALWGAINAANIAAKIDHLRVKLERAIERKRSKMQLRRQQRDAKIQALQTKADQAEGETRRRQEDRIAELQRDYEEKEAAG
jgi:hypothetical protein